MIEGVFWFVAALFAGLTILRCLLAWRYIHTCYKKNQSNHADSVSASAISIIQPIVGGDPALKSCLEQNLRNAPHAHFIWLLDEGDDLAEAATAQAIAATGRSDVIVSVAPHPPSTVNPKVHKLCRGEALATTPYLATLDDDTVLPPGTIEKAAASAKPGTLVTAMPTYDSRSNVLSRLITGFVNANASVTYPPAALLGLSRTVNGMFCVMRREDLFARGGFAAILHELTDDYALARLFLDNNGTIAQTCLCHPIVTTASSLAHYFRLMRRWMVCANIYIRENLSAGVLTTVIIPSMLPLPLLLLGIAAGPVYAISALALVAAKAWGVRWISALLRPDIAPLSDLIYEIAADFIMPIHAVAALIRPNRVRWRYRTITLDGSRITHG